METRFLYKEIENIINQVANAFSLKALAILPLFLCTCAINKRNETKGGKRIYTRSNYPIVKSDGELVNNPDSVSILFYQDLVFFSLPYEYIKSNVRVVKREDYNELIDSIIYRERRENYFVFKKNDIYGYHFKSLNDTIALRKELVDSVFTLKVFALSNAYNLIKTLSKIRTEKSANAITETYQPKVIGDDGDTIYLYYTNRLKDINFSFSRELDSASNLKLNKIRVICNEKFSPTYKMVLPKREFYFEFNELPVGDTQKIKEFISRTQSYWKR